MKVSALVTILNSLQEIAGGAEARQERAALVAILEQFQHCSVTADTCDRIRHAINGAGPMSFARTLRQLGAFRRASSEIARKPELKALDDFVDALEDQHASVPVRRKRSPAPTPMETVAARRFLAQLESVGADRQAFEALARGMSDDKSLSLAELCWIAQKYSGSDQLFSSKPLALKRIRSRFDTIERRSAKSEEIRRLTDSD